MWSTRSTGEFLGFLAHILWINFTGSSTLRNPGERAPERFQGLQATEGVLLTEPLAFLIVALRGCHARRGTRRSPLRAPPSPDERWGGYPRRRIVRCQVRPPSPVLKSAVLEPVGFVNSGGLVFVDESAEEVAAAWVIGRVRPGWFAGVRR
jgi:hypothetical protein